MPDFLPNRQRNQTPYQVNTTPGVPQSPFNSYNPTGQQGGGWQPGQPNPTMQGQVGTPGTATSFGTSPALDQNAVWNGYAGVRAASPMQANTSAPLPGQQPYGFDPWAGNAAGKAAFDQQRNTAMNSFGGFGPPGSAPTAVPPPPGAPTPSTVTPGGDPRGAGPRPQPNFPGVAPQGQVTGMAPQQAQTAQAGGMPGGGGMDQFAQMLQQQFGMDANQFQQFLSWISNQSAGPNYSTGGN